MATERTRIQCDPAPSMPVVGITFAVHGMEAATASRGKASQRGVEQRAGRFWDCSPRACWRGRWRRMLWSSRYLGKGQRHARPRCADVCLCRRDSRRLRPRAWVARAARPRSRGTGPEPETQNQITNKQDRTQLDSSLAPGLLLLHDPPVRVGPRRHRRSDLKLTRLTADAGRRYRKIWSRFPLAGPQHLEAPTSTVVSFFKVRLDERSLRRAMRCGVAGWRFSRIVSSRILAFTIGRPGGCRVVSLGSAAGFVPRRRIINFRMRYRGLRCSDLNVQPL